MTTPLVRNSIKPTKKFISAAFAVVILATGALTANAAPGDIFVGDYGSGTIYKFTPDGAQSIFAIGLAGPDGLAFDNAGNLFEANFDDNTIYKFAPDATRTSFVTTGLNHPAGLAFDRAGSLFEADY